MIIAISTSTIEETNTSPVYNYKVADKSLLVDNDDPLLLKTLVQPRQARQIFSLFDLHPNDIAMDFSKEELIEMKVKELKQLLLFKKLPTSGKKEELINRLLQMPNKSDYLYIYVTCTNTTILNTRY